MDALTTLVTGLLGPLGPIILVGATGVLLVCATVPFLLVRRSDPLDRLRDRARNARGASTAGPALRVGNTHDKLERYSTFLEPQDEAEYSAIRLRLVRAGYRGKTAVRTYYFAQFALGIGGLLAGAVYTLGTQTDAASTQSMAISLLLPGVVGYMAPKYWVTKRLQQRQEEIVTGFPDGLDMMLVCVEAGQSMDHSIARVAREIRPAFPALAEEYEMVANQIQAGRDKTQVLKDMGERAGVTDVSNFVTVLIQSSIFGTSVAEALRVYAAEMRDKRVMRAEEKANTLPTKMTLATMMLTVPPLLIILLGPSVLNIIETFSEFGL